MRKNQFKIYEDYLLRGINNNKIRRKNERIEDGYTEKIKKEMKIRNLDYQNEKDEQLKIKKLENLIEYTLTNLKSFDDFHYLIDQIDLKFNI